MNDLFFDELKKNLKENPISAAFLANKVQEAIDVKTFATVNQALKALKQGEFVVGYSYTPTGIEWDNAYRLQGNKFYAYKFTPFIVERPIRMFPSESAMLPACVSGEFLDDFIKVVLNRSMGLKPWQKMVLQVIVTGVFAWYLECDGAKGELRKCPCKQRLLPPVCHGSGQPGH